MPRRQKAAFAASLGLIAAAALNSTVTPESWGLPVAIVLFAAAIGLAVWAFKTAPSWRSPEDGDSNG